MMKLRSRNNGSFLFFAIFYGYNMETLLTFYIKTKMEENIMKKMLKLTKEDWKGY